MRESIKHNPALDSFRGLAVLAVMLFHYSVISAGWIGVQAFFVLSGYLITAILLADKDLCLRDYLVSFYIKRALRIWPLYYAFILVNLLVFLVMADPYIRHQLPYLLTYTVNFYQMRHVGLPWLMGHFWSLAVEEQFYLVWPFVIYFFSIPTLGKILPALFLAGPLLRGLALLFSFSSDPYAAMYRATSSYFDAFAIGGLIALPLPTLQQWRMKYSKTIFITAALALGAYALFGMLQARPADFASFTAFGLGGTDLVAGMVKYIFLNLFFAAAINYLVSNKPPAWLENRTLVYIGLISYGMYVFHPLARSLARVLPWPGSFTLRMPFYFAVTILASAASYKWLEKPILQFKERLKTRWSRNNAAQPECSD